MISYNLIFLFLCFLVLLENRYKTNAKHTQGLALIIILLFQALRWRTGTDWPSYHDFFFSSKNFSFFSFEHLELGYKIINYVTYTIYQSFTFFLFVECLINLVCIRYANKVFGCRNGSLVLLYMFVSAIFPVRINIASGILLAAYHFIIKRDLKRYFVVCLCAFLIHRSSLIFFPAYFIVNKDFSNKIIIGTYIVAVFLGLSVDAVFNNSLQFISLFYNEMNDVYQGKINAYTTDVESEITLESYFLSVLNALFFISLFCYFKSKYFINSKEYRVFLNLYALGLSINRLIFFALPDLTRTTGFFSGGFPFMIIMIIYKCKIKTKTILVLLFCLYCYLIYYKVLNGRFNDLYLPYYSIFELYNRPVY